MTGPFCARPFFDGKQFWKTLSAETFAVARDEADHLGSAFAAKAKGLTVAEFEQATNSNRIPLKNAVEAFLAEASMRYDADSLHDQFGARFSLIESSQELHETPQGITQQFLYCYCRVE